MTGVALLYHDVIESGDFRASGFPSPDARIYKLERNEFERHLDAIARTNREVLLTFDDGGVSFYDTIAPALEKRGWRGYFFIATNWIGTSGFVSAAQLRDLARRGHRIGTHSCSHPERISHCSFAAIVSEWTRSSAELSDILGERVDMGSVPGGYFSRKVATAAAAAGLRTLFTSEPTLRIFSVDGCAISGRFTVRKGTNAQIAASLARGCVMPRLRQSASWNAKKILKLAGGGLWLKFRKRVFELSQSA